jgi:hypothetical protein
MSLLEGLERLITRAACDLDARAMRALRRLWRASLVSIRTPAGGSALAARRPSPPTVRPRAAAGQSWRGVVKQSDHRNLTRIDVDRLWRGRNRCVVAAICNFAAVRFIRLPRLGPWGWEIETPIRDVVNAVGVDENLSKNRRMQVYNAVMIAFVKLPLGMELPSPFGIVDELDRIVGDDPQIRTAVQRVWSIVDDPVFWSAVGTSRAPLVAV